jgi:TolB-like protein/tetratricopeptide (TPR) repeat protein
MTNDRWRQISQVFSAALARHVSERPAFLRDACAGDAELQREVESLLAQQGSSESFLKPTAGVGTGESEFDLIGRQISSYKVVSRLGAGGMGEVYRARDTKLGRDVAIKVLPARFTADPDRVARFEHEARLLAALNHPHIGAIYGFENAGPVCALVLELVEGPTVADRLAKGPLPVTEALNIATQIAEALEAAHEKGVIHRDLKPANIKITPDGTVKVLDFGLAKASVGTDSTLDLSQLPTLTLDATQEGLIVGTPAYMSPEQARGQAVDKRTDIWAFGCVLYEMLTGRAPFRGATISDIIVSVLEREPDWSALPRNIPSNVRQLLHRCLEKNAKARLRDIGDARIELTAKRDGPVQQLSRRQFARAAPIVGVAVVLAAAGVAMFYRTTSVAPVRAVAVLPLENLSGDPEQEYFADGMTEQLTADLSSITALRVISRTSVMQYKKARKPLSDIARELNVDAVIEGSVVRVGDSVRITAKLIRAATEDTLWARSYERDLRDVLGLQKEVARSIASEVDITLTPHEQTRLAGARPVDPEVHRLVLLGRFHLNNNLTEESLKKALEYFEAAIAKDPGYAAAHVGVAEAYTNLASWFIPPREAMPKAKRAALSALKLDESLADAHAALGAIHLTYDWDGPAAERELQRALQLNPSLGTARMNYAGYLLTAERREEALQEVRQAVQLDPLSPKTYAMGAINSIFARRFDEAIQLADKALELDPNFALALAFRGLALAELGRYEEAVSSMQKAGQPDDNTTIKSFIAHVHAVAGNKDEARRMMQKVEEDAKQRYFCAYEVATSYVSLGDMDTAVKWFQRGIEERADCMAWLGIEPWVEPFRSDPRYAKLLRDVGLAPGAAAQRQP